MKRTLDVLSRLFLACAACGVAGGAKSGEALKYDFPLFENLADTVGKNGARQAALSAFNAHVARIGIPAGGTALPTDQAAPVFAEADKVAVETFDQAPAGTSALWWRVWFANEVGRRLRAPYEGQVDKIRELDLHRHAVTSQARASQIATDASANGLTLRDAFEQGVIAWAMRAGECDAAWGARALFHDASILFGRTRYIAEAGPQWANFELFRKTAGDEAAHKALAEAFLSSAIEKVLWQPIPGREDISWISEYAIGFTSGAAPKDEYLATIAALKRRAQAARGYFRVRQQNIYLGLVDQWLTGADGEAPLFKGFEDLAKGD